MNKQIMFGHSGCHEVQSKSMYLNYKEILGFKKNRILIIRSYVNMFQTLHINTCTAVQIVLWIYTGIACGNSLNAQCA